MAGQLYTAGKLAEALGVSASKVKKLLDELKIKEDAVELRADHVPGQEGRKIHSSTPWPVEERFGSLGSCRMLRTRLTEERSISWNCNRSQ